VIPCQIIRIGYEIRNSLTAICSLMITRRAHSDLTIDGDFDEILREGLLGYSLYRNAEPFLIILDHLIILFLSSPIS
jgi:hypothetical protein